MNKFGTVGLVGFGVVLSSAASALASPTVYVQVGSNSTTLGVAASSSGSYIFDAGSLNGYSWQPVIVTVSNNAQMTTSLGTVANSNGSSNGTISFTTTDSLSPNFSAAALSQQAGTAIASYASSLQTVEFSSEVHSSTSASLASIDSGALGLNSAMTPTSPSSSVSYNSPEVALVGTLTSTLTVTSEITLSVNGATTLNTSSLTTNLLSTGTVTPEPATLGILAVGGILLLARKKRSHPVCA